MRTILLYGELRKRFGKLHRLDVSTVAEAVRAMSVNFPGFESFLRAADNCGMGFKIITGNSPIKDECHVSYPLGESDHIKFVPILAGAGDGTFKIIAGAALIAIGLTTGLAPLTYLGAGLVLGGVSQMLSASPVISTQEKQPDNAIKNSYLFTGPVNNTRQGRGIPIGYGRMMVGSITVTSGISYEGGNFGYLSSTPGFIPTSQRPGGISSR